MKKTKLLAAALCSLSLVAGTALPVLADGTKVVTLGADLTQDQKNTMLRYFNVNPNEVQVMYITNQDERNHLGSYVPMEQIGTRTVSCVYVKPTSSGGIKVKTANLNWVTGNMIASTLSTSGVKNCEVIAACPFEVSGTGALTGVQMAYEQATGQPLDESKKEIATQELVVTGNLAEEVGTVDATNVVNQAKIEVIENNVVNNEEITNIVNNVVEENNINISIDQVTQIIELMQQIADEQYDYDDVRETLEHVEENVSGESSTDEIEQSQEEAYEEEAEESGESILDQVDTSVLGENIVQSSTEDQSLEEETYNNDTEEDGDWTVYEESPEETEGEESSESEEIGLTDEEIANRIAMLSEQAKYQYEQAKYFCEGEYLGDQDAMLQVYPEGMVPSVTIFDTDVATKLVKVVEDQYLIILSDGTASYEYTGNEKYFSTELNMMNEYLKKLFGIDGAALEGDQKDILADLTQEDRQALYDDTMKFFEKIYGESTFEESTEEYSEENYSEDYSEDTDGSY